MCYIIYANQRICESSVWSESMLEKYGGKESGRIPYEVKDWGWSWGISSRKAWPSQATAENNMGFPAVIRLWYTDIVVRRIGS